MGTLRHFDLSHYIRHHNCKTLVETGTFKGESIDYSLAYNFEQIYSIELYDSLAKQAKEKFKTNENVEIIHNSSVEGLKKIAPNLNTNCVFWLDAHFPGSDIGEKDYGSESDNSINVPILKELEIIAKRQDKFDDVIIIDDLRLFCPVPQHIQELWDQNPLHGVDGFNNHMERTNRGHVKREDFIKFDLVKEVEKMFPDHRYLCIWHAEGYLLICKIPKLQFSEITDIAAKYKFHYESLKSAYS